eukprot:scaffold73540_cov56-Phaeocystis_antarctica.AAC.4
MILTNPGFAFSTLLQFVLPIICLSVCLSPAARRRHRRARQRPGRGDRPRALAVLPEPEAAALGLGVGNRPRRRRGLPALDVRPASPRELGAPRPRLRCTRLLLECALVRVRC